MSGKLGDMFVIELDQEIEPLMVCDKNEVKEDYSPTEISNLLIHNPPHPPMNLIENDLVILVNKTKACVSGVEAGLNVS